MYLYMRRNEKRIKILQKSNTYYLKIIEFFSHVYEKNQNMTAYDKDEIFLSLSNSLSSIIFVRFYRKGATRHREQRGWSKYVSY